MDARALYRELEKLSTRELERLAITTEHATICQNDLSTAVINHALHTAALSIITRRESRS